MTSERVDGGADRGAASWQGVRAIVLGHGEFASGLVSAVAQITGRGGILLPISNHGLSGERLEETLRDALARSGACLVFTDLPGGSWTIAARRLQRELPSLLVVTGASLPMLLDVVYRDDAAPGEMAQSAADRGRVAVRVAHSPQPPAVHDGASGGPSRGGSHAG